MFDCDKLRGLLDDPKNNINRCAIFKEYAEDPGIAITKNNKILDFFSLGDFSICQIENYLISKYILCPRDTMELYPHNLGCDVNDIDKVKMIVIKATYDENLKFEDRYFEWQFSECADFSNWDDEPPSNTPDTPDSPDTPNTPDSPDTPDSPECECGVCKWNTATDLIILTGNNNKPVKEISVRNLNSVYKIKIDVLYLK